MKNIKFFFSIYTVKILKEAQAFIRMITSRRDGGGHLLEATSARKKPIKTSCTSNLSVRVAF